MWSVNWSSVALSQQRALVWQQLVVAVERLLVALTEQQALVVLEMYVE